MDTAQTLYRLESQIQSDAAVLAASVDVVCFSLEDDEPVKRLDLATVALYVAVLRAHLAQVEQIILQFSTTGGAAQ